MAFTHDEELAAKKAAVFSTNILTGMDFTVKMLGLVAAVDPDHKYTAEDIVELLTALLRDATEAMEQVKDDEPEPDEAA